MHLIELYKSSRANPPSPGLPCILRFPRRLQTSARLVRLRVHLHRWQPFPSTKSSSRSKPSHPAPRRVHRRRAHAASKELLPLMDRLLAQETSRWMIETAASAPWLTSPKPSTRSVDVKCPGAGSAANSFRLENLEALTKNDEVKFVITNSRRLRLHPRLHPRECTPRKAGQVLLSPAFVKIPSPQRTATTWRSTPKLVEWMLADAPRTPLPPTPQVHLGSR